MMQIGTLLCTFFFALNGMAWVSQYTLIKGVVKSFDEKSVVVEDSSMTRLIIPRMAVAKNYKLVSGQPVEIPVETNKVSEIKTGPSPATQNLKTKSEQALKNLKKGIAALEKK